MPGHKRQPSGFIDPYRMDITEIDGFDNLHRAEGILKEAQQRAAQLYGARESFFLVNGSTCGILAAVCAAVKRGGRILMARNSHKAVYHAALIGGIETDYLYPVITGNDLQGQITPGQVQDALAGDGEYQAVIITSPTFEGVISDVAGIAAVCHAKGIPLIVDSAHGAHLGLGHAGAWGGCPVHAVSAGAWGGFPAHAVSAGADAVIMSLHKTLPSPTQTALLHLASERIAPERIAQYLNIFETSSPSYLLMAGMDACIRMLFEEGEERFGKYRALLDGFYRSAADLRHLHVMRAEDLLPEEAFAWDDSKIVVFSKEDGETLSQTLLKRHKLQMEMASGGYVLGMTGIMDTAEGFDRLSKALHEIDAEADCRAGQERLWDGPLSPRGFIAQMYAPNDRRLPLWKAQELPSEDAAFSEAQGRICADFIALYPPGIPLIVPGEVISREFLERITVCTRLGLRMECGSDLSAGRIKIVSC